MNRKHTDEEREQSVLYYLESGKGMATISKELGIGVNTLNRWVRSYKGKHGISDNSRRPATNEELQQKIKELERENKEKARQLALKANLVKQQIKVEHPNELWAGDITYIKTELGWRYLAVVLDLFNGETVGYAISSKIDTDLVKAALGNALARHKTGGNIIFHSDRGCQYSSKAYQTYLEENGIVGSMSRPGCPYDNSCVESFFATLKKERIYRRHYETEIELGYIQIYRDLL